MASMGAQPPNPLELDITILSAKHLKNVNWRSGGDLKPYATIWVEPDRRMSTRPDEFGNTKPVWNETFSLPVPSPNSLLTVEICHSKPTDTPKPLVGTARVRLADLAEPDKPDQIHSLEIIRPSGRSQGKIRVKIGLRERPPPPPPPPASHPPPGTYPQDYGFAPPPPSGYFYSSAPPPGPTLPPAPAQRDYREYSQSPYAPPAPAPAVPPYNYAAYSDAYPAYYPNYYPRPHPPPPSRPFNSYGPPPPPPSGGGPSAPVDSGSSYDQRSAVGTVTGSLGILTLEERSKYEDERRGGERVAEDSAAGSGVVRDNFSDYRGKY